MVGGGIGDSAHPFRDDPNDKSGDDDSPDDGPWEERASREETEKGNGKGERTGLESSLAAAELRELGRWFGKIHSLTTPYCTGTP